MNETQKHTPGRAAVTAARWFWRIYFALILTGVGFAVYRFGGQLFGLIRADLSANAYEGR